LTCVQEPGNIFRGILEKRFVHRFKKGSTVRNEVEQVLAEVRPVLQADGGDVELVDIAGGVVKVRLKGACKGCPMAPMTLKGGIEAVLKERIPAVERVESV